MLESDSLNMQTHSFCYCRLQITNMEHVFVSYGCMTPVQSLLIPSQVCIDLVALQLPELPIYLYLVVQIMLVDRIP